MNPLEFQTFWLNDLSEKEREVTRAFHFYFHEDELSEEDRGILKQSRQKFEEHNLDFNNLDNYLEGVPLCEN